MRPLVLALAGVGFSVMLALFVVVILAVATGTSVAAGEAAAINAGVFDALLWIGAGIAYYALNRPLATLPRVLWTAGFQLANLIGLGLALLMSLVLLNR
jgi:hypothetical protein